jgi:hypothetical protein
MAITEDSGDSLDGLIILELVVLKITNEKWADRIHFVQFNSEYGAKENIIKIERKIKKMINIFRKMKQKSKDRIFSEYPCADFLHNALHFLARNKPEVTYGEICYALLKSGNKLTDEEQKIFDNYRKTGQLEMMSDDNIDDWEDTK